VAVTGLLDGQSLRIDNHEINTEIKGIENLHLHKTTEKLNDSFGVADIRIPLDGEITWSIEVIKRGKKDLESECRKAFKKMSREREEIFFSEIVSNMQKYNCKDLSAKELSLNVLSAFYPKENIKYIGFEDERVINNHFERHLFNVDDKEIRISVYKKSLKIQDITDSTIKFPTKKDIQSAVKKKKRNDKG